MTTCSGNTSCRLLLSLNFLFTFGNINLHRGEKTAPEACNRLVLFLDHVYHDAPSNLTRAPWQPRQLNSCSKYTCTPKRVAIFKTLATPPPSIIPLVYLSATTVLLHCAPGWPILCKPFSQCLTSRCCERSVTKSPCRTSKAWNSQSDQTALKGEKNKKTKKKKKRETERGRRRDRQQTRFKAKEAASWHRILTSNLRTQRLGLGTD